LRGAFTGASLRLPALTFTSIGSSSFSSASRERHARI
jgi:hypothetical protein